MKLEILWIRRCERLLGAYRCGFWKGLKWVILFVTSCNNSCPRSEQCSHSPCPPAVPRINMTSRTSPTPFPWNKCAPWMHLQLCDTHPSSSFRYSPPPPLSSKVISPHKLPRGGMTIMTEKNSNYSVTYLLMKNARPRDSGTYSCRPSNTAPVNVSVHVLDGQYSAS